MGKAALLIIASSIAFGSLFAFGARNDAKRAENRLATHQVEILARNAALAGYNQAKQNITDDYAGSPATIHGEYEGTPYDVLITKNGWTAHIESRAVKTTADGQEVDFTIDAMIERVSTVEMADLAPPFMRYAIMSDGDLNLDGNFLARLYVDGNEENTLNANMHTNGDLHLDGNAATVRGFGTYVGAATANPTRALTTAFDPYYNPTMEDVTQQVDSVEVPAFDIPTFTSKVNVDQTTAGTVSLSGTYDMGGTREDPYIWVIQGDLNATGGTNIKGYVMFIVDGNVYMSGNVDANQAGYEGSDESNVAYYASGTVSIEGNVDIKGQIFAGTGVSFVSGNPRIYGSVATDGAVTLSGTPSIFYRVASPALTTIFEEGTIKYVLLSYSEL